MENNYKYLACFGDFEKSNQDTLPFRVELSGVHNAITYEIGCDALGRRYVRVYMPSEAIRPWHKLRFTADNRLYVCVRYAGVRLDIDAVQAYFGVEQAHHIVGDPEDITQDAPSIRELRDFVLNELQQ